MSATDTTLTFENSSRLTACWSTSVLVTPGRLELGVGEAHHDPEARRLQRRADTGRRDGAHHDQRLGAVVHRRRRPSTRRRTPRRAPSAVPRRCDRRPSGWIESARYCTGPANNRSRNESRSAGRGRSVSDATGAAEPMPAPTRLGDRLPDRRPSRLEQPVLDLRDRPPSPPAPRPSRASPPRPTGHCSPRRAVVEVDRHVDRQVAERRDSCAKRSSSTSSTTSKETPVSTSASSAKASGPSTASTALSGANTPALPELASADAAISTMLPPVPSGSIASTATVVSRPSSSIVPTSAVGV